MPCSSLVPRISALVPCLLVLACGRSPAELFAAPSSTSTGPTPGEGSTSTGRLDAEGEPEVDDGETTRGSTGETTGETTGDPACTDLPDVRWLRLYDGEALRTVGGDLERGPDGTLYLGGTRADEDDMALWLAAAAPDGTLLWEQTALPKPGGNLAGSIPIAEDLVLAGDVLWFAGTAYDDESSAWHGRVALDGDFIDAEPLGSAEWSGIALADAATPYLAGRNHDPQGALLVRHGGRSPWTDVTIEPVSFADQDAAVTTVGEARDPVVAGRRGSFPWVGRFAASTGELLWSRTVLDTATFPAESGGMQAIVATAELVVAGGDARVHKPTATGSAIYNEIYLAAWSIDGTPRWSWQRGADEVYPGLVRALAVGPDGTIYATGQEEEELGGESMFFAAAFSPDGALQWSIDERSHGHDARLVDLHGVGLAAGDEGQLLVLAERRWLTEETTALLEICF